MRNPDEVGGIEYEANPTNADAHTSPSHKYPVNDTVPKSENRPASNVHIEKPDQTARHDSVSHSRLEAPAIAYQQGRQVPDGVSTISAPHVSNTRDLEVVVAPSETAIKFPHPYSQGHHRQLPFYHLSIDIVTRMKSSSRSEHIIVGLVARYV